MYYIYDLMNFNMTQVSILLFLTTYKGQKWIKWNPLFG